MSKFSAYLEKFKKYHFEIKHLIVLFIVLIFFMILVSLVQKTSLQELLLRTQEWYQRDSAERMANLTATSLELLLENAGSPFSNNPEERQRMVQSFNIILSQQILQQNVEAVCIFVSRGGQIYAIDDGNVLYDYFFDHSIPLHRTENDPYAAALALYQNTLQEAMRRSEQIFSIAEGDHIFHVFVPFVPKGEYVGAVYVKNTPDFTFITREIITSYDETALIFASLIILGLLAMFYISSYTVKERDEAQEQLYREREQYLLEVIDREKEALFTRRIYHTHHKAEKVMGFIKEDLRNLDKENIEAIKQRVNRYANFVSRVIYDMKWYDPPLQTIRNPAFQTDLNEVLQFIIDHIFLRTAHQVNYQFRIDLQPQLPPVSINEFVVWEIFEPLIQNCVEHGGEENMEIRVRTVYSAPNNIAEVFIGDNGKGFAPELLQKNEKGIKQLFLESVSTKQIRENAGYGCYIAYEIARRRCGWEIDAENLPGGGCHYVIKIPLPK